MRWPAELALVACSAVLDATACATTDAPPIHMLWRLAPVPWGAK